MTRALVCTLAVLLVVVSTGLAASHKLSASGTSSSQARRLRVRLASTAPKKGVVDKQKSMNPPSQKTESVVKQVESAMDKKKPDDKKPSKGFDPKDPSTLSARAANGRQALEARKFLASKGKKELWTHKKDLGQFKPSETVQGDQPQKNGKAGDTNTPKTAPKIKDFGSARHKFGRVDADYDKMKERQQLCKKHVEGLKWAEYKKSVGALDAKAKPIVAKFLEEAKKAKEKKALDKVRLGVLDGAEVKAVREFQQQRDRSWWVRLCSAELLAKETEVQKGLHAWEQYQRLLVVQTARDVLKGPLPAKPATPPKEKLDVKKSTLNYDAKAMTKESALSKWPHKIPDKGPSISNSSSLIEEQANWAEPACTNFCNNLFDAPLADDPQLREVEIEDALRHMTPANRLAVAAPHQNFVITDLSPREREILGDALFHDIRSANLRFARFASTRILSWDLMQDGVVRPMMAQFSAWVDWQEAADAQAPGWYNTVLQPMTGGLALDAHSARYENLAYYGHATAPANRAAFINRMNNGVIREQLSTMYCGIFQPGRSVLTLLGRTHAAWLANNAGTAAALNGAPNVANPYDFAFLQARHVYTAAHPCNRFGPTGITLVDPGWVMMKDCYNNANAGVWWQGASSGFKTTPWIDSRDPNDLLPPLSADERNHLFGGLTAEEQADAETYGRHVPWASGGDRVMSKVDMPRRPYSFVEWARRAGQRVWAAPSGSTNLMFTLFRFFRPGFVYPAVGGPATMAWNAGGNELSLRMFRALMVAWIEHARDHSTHEIMLGAEPHVVDYSSYNTVNHRWRYVWRDMFEDHATVAAGVPGLVPWLVYLRQDFEGQLDRQILPWKELHYLAPQVQRNARWQYPHQFIDHPGYRNRRAVQTWFLKSLVRPSPQLLANAVPLQHPDSDFGWNALDIPREMFPARNAWEDDQLLYAVFRTLVPANGVWNAAEVFIFNDPDGGGVMPPAMYVVQRLNPAIAINTLLTGCPGAPHAYDTISNCYIQFPDVLTHADYDTNAIRNMIVAGGAPVSTWRLLDRGAPWGPQHDGLLEISYQTHVGGGGVATRLQCITLTETAAGNAGLQHCVPIHDASAGIIERLRAAVTIHRNMKHGLNMGQFLGELNWAFPHALANPWPPQGPTGPGVLAGQAALASAWMCAQPVVPSLFKAVGRTIARCGGGALTPAEQAKVDCLGIALSRHESQCTFPMGGGPPQDLLGNNCDTMGWWRNLAELASVCMYTHEQGNFDQHMQRVTSIAFRASRTKLWMPPYEGVLFGGYTWNIGSSRIGTTLEFTDWASWSRNIRVSYWFQDFQAHKQVLLGAPVNWWREKSNTMFVLLHAPHGRQIGRVGMYGDSEQEVLTPPALYRVVGRRVFRASDPNPLAAGPPPIGLAQGRGVQHVVYVEMVDIIRVTSDYTMLGMYRPPDRAHYAMADIDIPGVV